MKARFAKPPSVITRCGMCGGAVLMLICLGLVLAADDGEGSHLWWSGWFHLSASIFVISGSRIAEEQFTRLLYVMVAIANVIGGCLLLAAAGGVG